jgi:hypothetical protein
MTSLNRRQALASAGAALLSPQAASAQPGVIISPGLVHGRDAFTISNRRLSLSVLSGGGFIGDVHLVSDQPQLAVNPLRVPEYQTMDPYKFDPIRDARYGTGIQRQLMAGYMGHFTCFPQFGGSQAEFEATGYGQHGELVISKWERLVAPSPQELLMAAHLPLNQYDFRRSIIMLPDETVAYVRETAQNLTRYERPCQWVQHMTMGPPFTRIGAMWVDGSADFTRAGRLDAGTQYPWPAYRDKNGANANARDFTVQSLVWIMQRIKGQNWLAAYSRDYNILFGHIYDAALNPWVLDWQSNQHQDAFPVPGDVVARGPCWGDSPVAGGIKAAVAGGNIAGIPAYSWMEPLAQREQNYVIFMAEIPPDWKGTAEIIAADGVIQIFESGTGKIIRLKAERV